MVKAGRRSLLLAIACALGSAAQGAVLEYEVIPVRGGTLHLDRGLLAHRDAAVAAAELFIERSKSGAERLEKLQRRESEAIAAVNTLLGVSPDTQTIELQRDVYRGTAASTAGAMRLSENFSLYIVGRDAAKEHLREGGTVPGVQYDATSDIASISYDRTPRDDGKIPPMESFTFPLDDPASLATLPDLHQAFESTAGLPIILHEVTELTLVRLVRFRPFQRRWFCDGMANTVAIEALKRLDAQQNLEASLSDLAKDDVTYEPLRGRVNLRYWLAKEYEVEAPLEAEKELRLARYHFATQEIMGLVERRGIDVIERITAAAIAEEPLTSREIVEVLERVTGEPVAERLAQYDEFADATTAAQAYLERYSTALAVGDRESALSALLRAMEARATSDYVPRFYIRAAELLRELEHGEAGADVLRQQIRTAANIGDAERERNLQSLYHSALVNYSLEADRLEWADASAEVLLRENEKYVDALAIRADRLAREGDLTGAQEIAERLIRDAADKLTPGVVRVVDRIRGRSAAPSTPH